VAATSSDINVATVDGPITVSDTAFYTLKVTHVRQGTASISFQVTSAVGSTYGDVVVGREVAVAVEATLHGFRVSSSQITVAHGGSTWLSIAPDTKLDSRVQLSLSVVPPGIATVSPASHFFEPASTFASPAMAFQLTGTAAGSAVIELRAKGGLYQAFVSSSQVTVTTLPRLPAAPTGLTAHAVTRAVLVLSVLPPGSGAGVDAHALPTGYRMQVSETTNFAKIADETTVTAPLASARIGPLVRGICYYYRVASFNSAGYSGNVKSPVCIRALDTPTSVTSLRVTAMTEQKALVQWNPPSGSGDGTLFGVPILKYVMQVVINGSAVSAEQIEVKASRMSIMLPILPANIYTLSLSAVTAVSESTVTSEHTASVYFAYAGLPVDYYVPLEFSVSTASLSAKVGRISSFSITPGSAPHVDAVVRIRSNQPSSASATTSHVIFRKGIMTAQTVVVTHRQRGDANLTFEVDGSNYRGLQESFVNVETLASDAVASGTT